MTIGYNPSQSNFYLVYPLDKLARVCFYVNKRLPPGSWSVTHHCGDTQTLTINLEATPQQEIRTIQIHNVYNPSPSSYSSREPGSLEKLRNCLEAAGTATGIEHIVVGDFNLHHPYWCGTKRLTQHTAADRLIDIADANLLTLATPKGTTTWRARRSESTIDLAFVSHPLVTKLIKCQPRLDLAQSSDHIPIETTLNLHTQPPVLVRRRCWKKADIGKIQEALKDKVPNTQINTNAQIDTRIHDLLQALQNAIEQGVPWAKPSQQANDYWTRECETAVREAKQAYYDVLREVTPVTTQKYKEARNKKIAIIRKHQRDRFRSHLAATTSTAQGAWKLMKWAKTSANQPRPLPQLPDLIIRDDNGQEIKTIKTLPEKLETLRNQFFPPPRDADLTDIPETTYPEPLETSEEIMQQEIYEALRWVSKDKAPGQDQIPNRILWYAKDWLIPRLNTVFNAALRNGYHPREWKKAITLVLRKPNKGDYTAPKAYRPIALLNTMGKLLELVIARRITGLAEANNLLPDTQMGARKGRSAETALQLITEQVHAIWGLPGPKRVATLLSLDISGAFDNVSHERLAHDLKKRRIPLILINWIISFLQDRETTIKLFKGESPPFKVIIGIS
jgi:retrotransposon-encoded endonuclease/reverse transcriptase-like protein